MPNINIAGKLIDVAEGENLRTALIANGYQIKSPCGGCASCGQCVVIVTEGEENLSEFSFEERQILGNVFHITKERLSCQTHITGDISLDISLHLEDTVDVKKKKTIVRKKEDILENEKVMVERPPRQGGYRKPKAFKEFKIINKDKK